jgi:hypothetical protein
VVAEERKYPKDLAERVRDSWPAHAYPLPKQLVTIFDVAYHASFLRDEERPVIGRLLVLPPTELPPDTGPPTGLLPLRFDTPRRFEEHELRRLSPAAPVHRTLIAVDESGGELRIWGMVQSGPRWLQTAQGGRAPEPPMPPCLIVRVVATLRSMHHGGTIVVGPPDCAAERYFQTKYAFLDNPTRRRFRSLVLSILEAVAEHAAAVTRTASVELYRTVTDPRIAEFDEGLFEVGHLIASLAAVDGAVVMTKRFEILGFGAEIAGSLPPVTEVRRAVDLEADTFMTELVDTVGTRHRSAYRFCHAVPDAVAVVVSQDGSVRFVNRHRDAVTYWDHGLGGD